MTLAPLAVPLGAPETLLDLLPLPLLRWDLPTPLEAPFEPAATAGALVAELRLGYANPAAATLLGETHPAALAGLPLGRVLAAGEAERAFRAMAREDFRAAHRAPGPSGQPATWHGLAPQGQLWSLWMVVEPGPMLRADPVEAGTREATSAIIGDSAPIRRVLEQVTQVSGTDVTVLIRGETGTGKELIARAIHAGSARRNRPLIVVNCGAIASGLVESELFGHEKGAFTGAVARKPGQIELADGGTLFLDEIGDLAPPLQVKLLRVLQEGELLPVGGTVPRRVNVRVIAATHRDLPAMVTRGEFRQDLYYRLNVFPVHVPALRERAEDIPRLAAHLAQRYAARHGKAIHAIPSEVLTRLVRHQWPGNIRELANLMERSVIVSRGTTLQLAEWATGQNAPVPAAGVTPGQSPRVMLDVEREHIRRTLDQCRWKVSGPGGAAEVLGLKPTTLEARMKRLGLERPRG